MAKVKAKSSIVTVDNEWDVDFSSGVKKVNG